MTDSTTVSCGSGKDRSRVYTCLRCAHAISDVEQHALRFKVDCPACGRKDSFGPGVFVEDFEGYTMAEVARQRASKSQP